jgi:hypothetical protein
MSSHHTATAEQLDPSVPGLRDEIRLLVEAGQIDEARRRLGEAIAAGAKPSELGGWPAVLLSHLLPGRKAVTRPGAARGDFVANMKWLEEHRGEHRGEWVAMRDGVLVDSDRSRTALTERLERTDLLDGALFVQVEE